MVPLEKEFKGSTFNDFMLLPQHGVLARRRDANCSMPLAGEIDVQLPLIGANMDTVTGPEMAKTLALEGGIGFLHRNCSIDTQVQWVRYVKTRHAYVIEHPVVLPCRATLREAKQLIDQHKASGILVEETAGSGILAGILSHRDIPWDNPGLDLDMPVERLMTSLQHLVIADENISIEDAERKLFEIKKEKLPLVDKSLRIKGLITMRDLKLYRQKPYANKDRKGRLIVGGTIGATGDFLIRAEALIAADADCILMDVAHADAEYFGAAVRQFREKWPDVPLIGGNVATATGAQYLVRCGVDAVKVGVGPGAGCRTRLETGYGVGQLEAIRAVYCGTNGRIPIIADGGVKDDKDIFLAIACGATTVMLGSMLSGTDEAPGVLIEDPVTKQKAKLYRGMTSPEAVADGSTEEARTQALQTPAEGQSVQVPYIGSVVGVLNRIRGHLQSSVSYSGSRTLQEVYAKISANPLRWMRKISLATQIESKFITLQNK